MTPSIWQSARQVSGSCPFVWTKLAVRATTFVGHASQARVPSAAVEIGRRIVVYGVTGSGKTTFARRLGDARRLHVIELDAIRHARRWDGTSWDEMRTQVIEQLDAHPDGWVCEGNYREVRGVILPRADTAIWLHLPWHLSFRRLLLRTVHRAWTKEPLYGPGSPSESWRTSFLDSKSILWWAIHHHGKTTRGIAEALRAVSGRVHVHELRTPAAVEELLTAARRDPPSAPHPRGPSSGRGGRRA